MQNRLTKQELLALRRRDESASLFDEGPLLVKKVHGVVIQDIEGKKFIDFGGAVGAQNVGYCAKGVVAAIKDQVNQFIHTCLPVATSPFCVELAERINDITPGTFDKKTFFVNSGSEAIDEAIKTARYVTKRQGIIAFQNAFHGRTYMGMTLTTQVAHYKRGFGPFCPEIYRMPFGYCYRCPFGLTYPLCEIYCADYLEDFFASNIAAESVAAVIAEPLQGQGGCVVPPQGFFIKIKAICEKYGILFIADEVHSGMGSSGKLFAIEHFDVIPDIILIGDSMAAGLPLGGVTGRAEILKMVEAEVLAGMNGGNPIAVRASLAVLDALQGELLDKAKEVGTKVRDRLSDLQEKYDVIGEIRGLGCIMGMELVRNRKTKEPATNEAGKLVKECHERGLVILKCGVYQNVIRIVTPLGIADQQLEDGLSIIDDSLSRIRQFECQKGR